MLDWKCVSTRFIRMYTTGCLIPRMSVEFNFQCVLLPYSICIVFYSFMQPHSQFKPELGLTFEKIFTEGSHGSYNSNVQWRLLSFTEENVFSFNIKHRILLECSTKFKYLTRLYLRCDSFLTLNVTVFIILQFIINVSCMTGLSSL